MQIGDPKKTAVLAVVAVGAIGFLVTQLMPGGGGPKSLRQAAATPGAATGEPAAGGTLVSMQLDNLRTDAFSHPKLVKSTAGPGEPTGSGETMTGGPGPIDLGNQGTGLSGPLVGPISGGQPTQATGTTNPPIKAGAQPPVQVEKVTQVVLRGLVQVNRRMAYISVNGEEARGFGANDLLTGDIVVTAIGDDYVTLKSTKKTVTLKVGQQGDL